MDISTFVEKAMNIISNQYGIAFFFTVFDYITGTVAAIANHKFRSSVMRQGIFHKFALWMVLIFAASFDWAMNYVDFSPLSDLPISADACAFIAVMEMGSIMENLHRANNDIPGSLTDLLERLRRKEAE